MNAKSKFVPFDEVKILDACPYQRSEMNQLGSDCYHCDSCDKKVFDFSDCTETAFNQILRENDYNICGIFDASQIEQSHQKDDQRKTLQSLFLAAIFLISCLTTSPVMAQSDGNPNKEIKRRTINKALIEKQVTPSIRPTKKKRDTPPTKEEAKKEKAVKPKRKQRKKRSIFRKRRYRTGCPVF